MEEHERYIQWINKRYQLDSMQEEYVGFIIKQIISEYEEKLRLSELRHKTLMEIIGRQIEIYRKIDPEYVNKKEIEVANLVDNALNAPKKKSKWEFIMKLFKTSEGEEGK